MSRVFRPVPCPHAELRLFCFHSAGYGAAMYRDWGSRLAPAIEVCAIRMPGRENLFREPLLHTFDELVTYAIDIVRSLIDRPYAFFGHSMGAWLAFETARQLASTAVRPLECLFVSGREAPDILKASRQAHLLADEELVRDVQQRYQGIPGPVLEHPELLQMLLPVLRADLAALDSYRYARGAPLSCPLVCYSGSHDTEVTVPELDAWRSQTTGTFELRIFRGNHFYLSGPAFSDVIAHVREKLRPEAFALQAASADDKARTTL